MGSETRTRVTAGCNEFSVVYISLFLVTVPVEFRRGVVVHGSDRGVTAANVIIRFQENSRDVCAPQSSRRRI